MSDEVSSDANETAADPVQETKRRFKEALAAKQARHGEDHLSNGPGNVQAHGPVDQKRTFRRKTG